MRVKWHYYCSFFLELLETLQDWHVNVEVISAYNDGFVSIPAYLVFDIYEDDPFFQDAKRLIPHADEGIPTLCYSDEERNAAQWLTVRGTNMQLHLEEDSGAFYCTEYIDENRARHRYRTGKPFSLRKAVKWNRRHFFCCAYALGEEYLFCNDLAKDVLIQHKCAVHYEPVYHARTKQVIPNLTFLDLTQVIPREDIRWQRGATEIVCPQCGKTQIDYGGDFQLCASEAVLQKMGNLFRTEALFGGGNLLRPINIVTQELYQALRQQAMTRNLVFTPVVPF